MGRLNTVIATGLMATAAIAAPTSTKSKRSDEAAMVWSHDDVPHSADLTWVPCYGNRECANLVVPLDYADPEVGTTWIAFARSKGANSTGQDILYNPGGPGGSGVVHALAGTADDFHAITQGKYNFVSFDPRGVNASGISLTCFPEDPESATSVRAQASTPIDRYYGAIADGKWCSASSNETELRYASTSALVQDMMHFTELQAALNGHKNPKESDIWFWGTSYGTVVAQTLSAMYPDRIGRVVSDANVNGEEYYNGAARGPLDAEKSLDTFLEDCYKAGPETCEFAGKSKSADELKQRLLSAITALEKEPLVTVLGGPSIITKDTFLGTVFSALYAPIPNAESLDARFVAVETRNATKYILIDLEGVAGDDSGPFDYTETKSQEVLNAVTRLDSNGRYPFKSVEDYLKGVEEFDKISPLFGEGYTAANSLIPAGWTLKSPESQAFPGFDKNKKIKTKNPLLFINADADPITPLAAAKHMSEFFIDSVVLEQNSGGHGFTAAPSKCTFKHLREYLANATLPPKDTICEPDLVPFGKTAGSTQKRSFHIMERNIARRR